MRKDARGSGARARYGAGDAADIRREIGADSLGYLNIARLSEMVGGLPICTACFSGNYPIDPPTEDIRGEYIR